MVFHVVFLFFFFLFFKVNGRNSIRLFVIWIYLPNAIFRLISHLSDKSCTSHRFIKIYWRALRIECANISASVRWLQCVVKTTPAEHWALDDLGITFQAYASHTAYIPFVLFPSRQNHKESLSEKTTHRERAYILYIHRRSMKILIKYVYNSSCHRSINSIIFSRFSLS